MESQFLENKKRNGVDAFLGYMLTCWILVFPLLVAAQELLPPGTPLIRQAGLLNMTYEDSLGEVRVAQEEKGTQLYFKTYQQPPYIYNLSRRLPLEKTALKTGQLLLLSFRAKTVAASLETGEAKALWVLRQTDTHRESIQKTVSIGSEWRTYYFPFEITQDVNKEDLSLSIQFGYLPQEFVLTDVALTLCAPEVKKEDLPKTRLTYPGEEEEAPWRQDALRRIERNRKGAISLQLVDEAGQGLADIPVKVKLLRHDFGWGAAVNARQLIEEPVHLEKVAQAFNLIVFENDLKIKRWAKAAYAKSTLEAIALLKQRDIAVKGHVLIWPGFQYLLPKFQKLADQPERIAELMQDHLTDILAATHGQIQSWDVVNEAYTNRDLQNATGSEEILYNGFRYLHAQEPEVLRFTNEFGIISKGGHDTRKQEWYYEYIQRIDAETGGLVDGIGVQCHMGSDLTPPVRVLELLDYYAQLDKKISISEFTIDVDDPEVRYDYTRDFLIAAFSHPAVSEFLFWGYYEPTHPKAAIYDENWQPADMGLAFFSLVHHLWTTKIEGATDIGGRIQGRGFYGTYEYEYIHKGETVTGTFDLLPEQAAILQIKVP
ncbi:endo-1,4-beta-xylanase [Lewinella sp. LCG006]|uniref:endo-1,4-beta-xylanase n=1 Tax=Lewinella sp. LCG006 TaxID=3231911 RepID=UPI00345F56B7